MFYYLFINTLIEKIFFFRRRILDFVRLTSIIIIEVLFRYGQTLKISIL